LLTIAWILSACGGDCTSPRAKEVRDLLEKELKAGDVRERVDEVLTKAGIAYGYDRFQNRYQGTVTDPRCGQLQAVSVYVYFDSSGK
jgi:hypothetical protein